MITKLIPINESTLEEFADKHSLVMEIHERGKSRLPGVKRWYAHFRNSDIKDGGCLVGVSGDGDTTDEALSDYASRISEELLVIDAYDASNRREITVPRLVGIK